MTIPFARCFTAVAAAGVLALAAVAAPAAQAAGSPSLSVSRQTLDGGAKDVRITVTGRSYLVPPHQPGAQVFGGVYVFFGWVQPGNSWGPSDGGSYGTTYAYPGGQGDAGSRGGDGATQFVSFTDAGVSGGTTKYHMDDDGGWRVPIVVPGPTFTYDDPSGTTQKVDCRTMVCGIFTIGAHGKASATNELLVRLTFRAAPKPTPSPTKTAKPKPSSSAASPSSSATEGTSAGSPAPSGSPNGSSATPVPATSQSLAVIPSPSGSPSAAEGSPAAADVQAASPSSGGPARAAGLAAVALAVALGVAWVLRRSRGGN